MDTGPGQLTPSGDEQPHQRLADLPPELWDPLLWAVRRAVDRLPRSELPAVLRPFAGWKPDRLTGQRPRRAIAEALVQDPVLREHVGEALRDRAAYAAAADVDAGRLASAHGPATAIAALAARGRWDDVATVAAAAAEQLAGASRAAGESVPAADAVGTREAARQQGSADNEAAHRRLQEELKSARQERDRQRRRADAAEERVQRLTAELAELRSTVDALHAEVADREERIDQLRQRQDNRVARLHRRVEHAEARARVDDERVGEVADALDELVRRLRGALRPEEDEEAEAASAPAEPVDETGPPGTSQDQGTGSTTNAVPRDVPPASPGRPSILPAGLVDGTPAAVRSLLQAPRLQVVVDGYNVTMTARATADLDGQRRWLVGLAASVAARFGRLVTVVFDGTEPGVGGGPSARGVRVVFSAGEETADERIVALLKGLSEEAPVLVVSDDREVVEASEALGADVSPVRAFLEAVGG